MTFRVAVPEFQWAPTLGGECYRRFKWARCALSWAFQWAPTLGGECYATHSPVRVVLQPSFNGHPPLGVNATLQSDCRRADGAGEFQWAPTLGGECYPNELLTANPQVVNAVSMGTHPWG